MRKNFPHLNVQVTAALGTGTAGADTIQPLRLTHAGTFDNGVLSLTYAPAMN